MVFLGALASAVFLVGRYSESVSKIVDEQQQSLVLQKARSSLDRGQVDFAEKLAAAVLKENPQSAAAKLVLAEVDGSRQQFEQAVNKLDEIDPRSGSEYLVAMNLAGNFLIAAGKLSQAEQRFQRVLDRDANDLEAHKQLSQLLTMEGRRWESLPHLLKLVQHDAYSLHHLLMLGDQQSVIDFSADLQRSLDQVPGDAMARLGLARIALDKNDRERSLQLIHQVIAVAPRQMEAQLTLGQLLMDGPSNDFLAWRQSLPAEAEDHPELWYVSGRWIEEQGHAEAAIRCYWETVKRNPNHRQAVYRLGRLLVSAEQHELAAPFLDRAKKLEEFAIVINTILKHPNVQQELWQAARLAESLGRLWESYGWYSVLAAQQDPLREAQRQQQRLHERLQPEMPLTLPTANPALAVDLSSYALPKWPKGSLASPALPKIEAAGMPRFVDRAGEVGLVFTYNNGDDPKIPGWEIYQELGGGVGVLDYDRDGWPDVYLTQGSDWPPTDQQSKDLDRLFRNLGGQKFQDISDSAHLMDARYSQGIATGDFDNDGFPDLYVANIGGNRLYKNQGDGVFVDVTAEAGLDQTLWTTSCLIADLNGDGLPDLYDTNYLAGDRPFTDVCVAQGIRRACSPQQFEGEQDQLYLNLGNGQFANVTGECGIAAPHGKGLGLIAADFDDSGQLSLFIANDGTPNFFYKNLAQRGERPRFAEMGVESGLAFNADGRSEACMGVAFDDANRDGRWDLFVTNFHKESNTLYRQQSHQLFADETKRARLMEPSLPYTGFGTQFLDAELDGRPDLVVLNGHIDDFLYQGIPFKMRSQFFHNLNGTRFQEIPQPQVGEYFSREQLGRALARLDWNRDGRTDLIAMHLDAPAAVLQNETSPVGHFLKVYLCGVQSGRDAIGTIVRIQLGEGVTDRKQLAAGDGFHSGNERVLTFGLGEATRVEQLHVRWPSGSEQTWKDLESDAEIVLVETGQLIPLTR